MWILRGVLCRRAKLAYSLVQTTLQTGKLRLCIFATDLVLSAGRPNKNTTDLVLSAGRPNVPARIFVILGKHSARKIDFFGRGILHSAQDSAQNFAVRRSEVLASKPRFLKGLVRSGKKSAQKFYVCRWRIPNKSAQKFGFSARKSTIPAAKTPFHNRGRNWLPVWAACQVSRFF